MAPRTGITRWLAAPKCRRTLRLETSNRLTLAIRRSKVKQERFILWQYPDRTDESIEHEARALNPHSAAERSEALPNGGSRRSLSGPDCADTDAGDFEGENPLQYKAPTREH